MQPGHRKIQIIYLNLQDTHIILMEFIDTHAHLYDEAFANEEDSAVERALEAGVKG